MALACAVIPSHKKTLLWISSIGIRAMQIKVRRSARKIIISKKKDAINRVSTNSVLHYTQNMFL